MDVKINADIIFKELDKPEKPFKDEEWADHIKLTTEADEVIINHCEYSED